MVKLSFKKTTRRGEVYSLHRSIYSWINTVKILKYIEEEIIKNTNILCKQTRTVMNGRVTISSKLSLQQESHSFGMPLKKPSLIRSTIPYWKYLNTSRSKMYSLAQFVSQGIVMSCGLVSYFRYGAPNCSQQSFFMKQRRQGLDAGNQIGLFSL